MRYETALTGLEFYSYHGVYAEERRIGALFYVDLKVTREAAQPIQTLDEATNYELLFHMAKTHMARPEALLEVVAQRILNDMLETFPGADLEVSIHKPNPAGVFKSGTASVKLVHTRG